MEIEFFRRGKQEWKVGEPPPLLDEEGVDKIAGDISHCAELAATGVYPIALGQGTLPSLYTEDQAKVLEQVIKHLRKQHRALLRQVKSEAPKQSDALAP